MDRQIIRINVRTVLRASSVQNYSENLERECNWPLADWRVLRLRRGRFYCLDVVVGRTQTAHSFVQAHIRRAQCLNVYSTCYHIHRDLHGMRAATARHNRPYKSSRCWFVAAAGVHTPNQQTQQRLTQTIAAAAAAHKSVLRTTVQHTPHSTHMLHVPSI